ncbi:MAG: hypothetical protein MUC41_15965 [Syntrophobacteraceae bacterium]|jgi:hypothetical protein|nr:hypothetical protein [Syntrophobacteraceae bacterium]
MEPARVLDFSVKRCHETTSEGPERFRDAMHEELDKFLDKLMVVFEKDERPRVAELSDFMTQSRQDFLGSCLQHMIEERYSAELSMEESPCPRCGNFQFYANVPGLPTSISRRRGGRMKGLDEN